MGMATPVQIVGEVVCISNSANTIEKGMNPSTFSVKNRETVG